MKEGVTLSEIADEVYLSKRQVSRIISKEYGCSLPELINNKRLKAAEILLRTKNLSVARVADEVGISSSGYFYTLFKAKYGVTPLQYRKMKRKE
jgi:AraC-like DNA-binding protein